MLGIILLLLQADRITGQPFATRSEIIAPNAAAATSQPLATQIALDILKKGGSAIDAAIAANAALGLMEPTGCGIGGDIFAIVWDPKTKKLYGLNGSGRSPLGLDFETLKKEVGENAIPPYGHLPVTVPGAVDGWFTLHERFGRLPMSEVLQPAIDYARNGFPVSELIAYYWAKGLRIHKDRPGAFAATFSIGGNPPKKGDVFRNPDLANTYSLLASNGRDAFYKGEIARKSADYFESIGGYLTLRDFEAHKSEWVDPVSVNYRGYEVFELPPNGQGIAALQMLNILKQFDLKAMGFQSIDALHLMAEAKKLAFEDRAKFYADPHFFDVPLEGLLSEAYARQRAKLIDMGRSQKRLDAGTPNLFQGDTIYLTTADQDGMMVSLIQSNYRGMGSGLVAPGLGFCFQDRGQLFSMEPGHANQYAPGKRPFHTIIPAFVMRDGQPFLSFGVMGGDMQPQGHVQILVNMIDFGLNLQEAGDASRWRHSGSSSPTDEIMKNGGYLHLESGIPWETRRGLRKRGHQVQDDLGGYGGYQAIMWDPVKKVYFAASESRKDGQAAGY